MLAAQAGIWDLGSGISWAVTLSRTSVDRNVTSLTRLSWARDQSGFSDHCRPAAQVLEPGQRNVSKLTSHPTGERETLGLAVEREG